MFCILFGLWIVFNGKWTGEIALLGLFVCALIYGFTCKYIGLSPKQEWRYLRKAGKAMAYLGFLLGEIVKANLQVLRLVWSPRLTVEPELHSFRTKLKSEFGKTILANSITLTPGTITVHVRADLFLVHCLDREMGQCLENSEFEQKVLKMEGSSDER